MDVIEKLLLVAIIAFFNESGHSDKELAQQIASISDMIVDVNERLTSLPSCSKSMSQLMETVFPVGKNPEYDTAFEKIMICISETRHAFDELSQTIHSIASNLNVVAPEESTIPEVVSIPSLNVDIHMHDIDETLLVHLEGQLKFLSSLRAVFKRVRSVDSIRAEGSFLNIHFKEGRDLRVEIIDEENQIRIQSAVLEPSYPCFQAAIEYALSRNDIGLLSQQTITGLYASQRLHKEVETLKEKATITTEDDVTMHVRYADGTEIVCSIPVMYPNTLGLVKVETIDGPKKEAVEKAMEGKAFSLLSELVKYVYNAIEKCLVFLKQNTESPIFASAHQPL